MGRSRKGTGREALLPFLSLAAGVLEAVVPLHSLFELAFVLFILGIFFSVLNMLFSDLDDWTIYV